MSRLIEGTCVRLEKGTEFLSSVQEDTIQDGLADFFSCFFPPEK